jgi:hypothetical protein
MYLLVYLIGHGWEVNMVINLGDITCIDLVLVGGRGREQKSECLELL